MNSYDEIQDISYTADSRGLAAYFERRTVYAETWLPGGRIRGVHFSTTLFSNTRIAEVVFEECTFTNCSFMHTGLSSAVFKGCTFDWVVFENCSAFNTDFGETSLHLTHFRGTNLDGAKLRLDSLPPWDVAPPTGAFDCYKLVLDPSNRNRVVEVKLHVPARAKRVTPIGSRQIRVSEARVISGRGISIYNSGFEYNPRGIVVPDQFCDDPRVLCTFGIHAYMSREEAINEA